VEFILYFAPKQRSKQDLSNPFASVSQIKAKRTLCPKQQNSTSKILLFRQTFRRNKDFLVSNPLPETAFIGALVMPLIDVLSLDGLDLAMPLVQDRVLLLRLVSRKFMLAMESNFSLKLNFRINAAGADSLTACFLQRFHGIVHLHCARPWVPSIKWFDEISEALVLGRLRPLRLLCMSVEGNNLRPLVEILVGLVPAVQQLEIAYRGNCAEILAAVAPIASLGHALTMDLIISMQEFGSCSHQESLLLRHLSSVRIYSASFRSHAAQELL
jgi:hypothetical protein